MNGKIRGVQQSNEVRGQKRGNNTDQHKGWGPKGVQRLALGEVMEGVEGQ